MHCIEHLTSIVASPAAFSSAFACEGNLISFTDNGNSSPRLKHHQSGAPDRNAINGTNSQSKYISPTCFHTDQNVFYILHSKDKVNIFNK